MKKTMKIKYTGGLNDDLEENLNVFLKQYGYFLTGSGMLIGTQVRDLAYEHDTN